MGGGIRGQRGYTEDGAEWRAKISCEGEGVEVRICFVSQPGSDWGPHMDDRYLEQGTEIRDTQYKHGGKKAATSRKLH